MSRPLSIKFASECAFSAFSDWEDLIDRNATTSLDLGAGNIMQLEPTTFKTDLNILNARTYPFHGGTTLAKRDQMGVIRKGTGSRKSEVLITFRGSSRLWNDYVLIDCATALGTSPQGFAVHGGFAKVIQSCLPEIKTILAQLRPFHTVHCVGHSMGGALATLCAEYFLGTYTTPYLYTFGAPRVGLLPHAQYMRKKMGNRIYRYYYAGDVVTWLPMFPFAHMPGKRLISPANVFASHVGYMESSGLVLADRESAQTTADSWAQAEQLIDQGHNVGGGCGMESISWRYFTIALHKILSAIGAVIGTVLIPCITVVDQIISCISYLVTQNPDRRPLIIRWLVGSFKALGKAVVFGTDKLVAMLRYILSLMLSNIETQSRRELANANYVENINRNRRPNIHFA